MANSSLYNTFFSKNGNKRQKGGAKSNVMELLYEKKSLLVKTFANLIVQLGITYYVMEKTPANKNNNTNNNAIIYLYLFGGIFLLLFMSFVPMPSWMKFIIFCVFSYLTGLLLSLLKLFASNDVINMAMQGTISIFAVMFAFGVGLLVSGIKLGIQTALFLLGSLLTLILLRIVFWFSGASSAMNKMLTFLGLILFSAYIVYDTNSILQREYYGDFITASLDYYLDIINIFVKLVSLEGNN
jgi:FtsH-binding integral membrane protein